MAPHRGRRGGRDRGREPGPAGGVRRRRAGPGEAKAAARANEHYAAKLRGAAAGWCPSCAARASSAARPSCLWKRARLVPDRELGVRVSHRKLLTLGELRRVEADRGGGGEVEALRPAAHRDAHPGVGQRGQLAGTPRASLPKSQSTGPASRVRRDVRPAPPLPRRRRPARSRPAARQARAAASPAARSGRRRGGRGCRRWRARPCRCTGRPSRRRTRRRRRRTASAVAQHRAGIARVGELGQRDGEPRRGGEQRRRRGRRAGAQTATRPWGVTVSDSAAAAFR